MVSLSFYRERAAQSQIEADSATLDNVRDRHLAARDVWLDMVDRQERTLESRDQKAAEAQARLDDAPPMGHNPTGEMFWKPD